MYINEPYAVYSFFFFGLAYLTIKKFRDPHIACITSSFLFLSSNPLYVYITGCLSISLLMGI